jgi:hypothetical protein
MFLFGMSLLALPVLSNLRAQPSHATINDVVWGAGIALQLALVVALFTRRIARRLPCFTALIVFYLLRSALLFLLYGHVDDDAYQSLYDGLLLFELLAEAAFVAELLNQIMRSLGGWTLRRTLVPAVFLLISSVCTLVAAAVLPARAPVPVDRTQLFFSFLMILLFAWAQSIAASSTIVRKIAAGFALYGIVNVSANLGRSYAAIHKDVALYSTWSYALDGIYLVVVIFWLVTLRPLPGPSLSDPESV